ncbi:putative secreted protein, YBBR [Fructilactobacillus florum 8D]|uniref:Putative secreted protein, YBBR n=1 Tax=Fructilactobacillus florum 8D TaxID=1221538 RepID=W9EDY0_9LACO|nr:CdaR family protein [Fructilactobacillus florum]ETO40338.1 putative secreted protein, YBBR [Fructilactobacillus florum 8D]
MKHFYDSKTFALIVSFLIVMGLFFMVHDDKLGNTYHTPSQTSRKISAVTRKTVEVPLQLNVNSDHYFVIGYPDKVKVTLQGPAALVTTTANTQNFKVNANLVGLTPGKHVVKLQPAGLNSEINAKINPDKIKINLQKRATKTYAVKPAYDKNQIATGHHVVKTSQQVQQVHITGPIDEIERIKQVVAQVNLQKPINKTTRTTAVIDAQDLHGKTVNVVISPSTTKVKLEIAKDDQTTEVPKQAEKNEQ